MAEATYAAGCIPSSVRSELIRYIALLLRLVWTLDNLQNLRYSESLADLPVVG
jgi:hypothetical protein